MTGPVTRDSCGISKNASFIVTFALASAWSLPTFASYHFMQIEKIVGGVNGDTTAQAVQLRMRAPAQDQINRAKLVAYDANGENPVVIVDFSNTVRNGDAGSRVLIASVQMRAYTDQPLVETFTMEELIPESYLAAGSLVFENDDETLIVWRLSWGGSAYTGSTLGALTNDDDREFGPPYPGPLPALGLEVLEFTGDYGAKSTSNALDYALSGSPGVLTNNSNESFTLVIPDCGDPEGQGPDSDGDSVRDACEVCPEDPFKTEAGICGCGVSDVDSDVDGTPDCHDPDQGGVPPDNDNQNENQNENTNANDNSSDNNNTNANDNVGNDNSGNDNAVDPPGNQNDNGGSGGGSGTRPCSMGVGALSFTIMALMALRFSRSLTRTEWG